MGIPLVPCELAGIVVESAIYGMFLITFIACLYVLVSGRRIQGGFSPAPVNKPMLVSTLILFFSITIHWILDITRLFQAFVSDNPDPAAYYGDLSNPINVAKTALYIFSCLVGDLIMCYRLWTLWNHKLVVCSFPLASILGFIVSGIGITYQFSQLRPGQPVFLKENSRWITSAFTFTLATNIYCTGAISYKIWSIDRAVRGFKQSHLSRVIIIVVESAAIYTACSLITLTSFLANSNIQFPGLDSTSPVVGFVFCLIIVRVSLGLDHNGAAAAVAQGATRSWTSGTGARQPFHFSTHGQEYSMNRVNISISHHIETDRDDASERKAEESIIP